MTWLTADLVNAFGIAVATVIGAVTTWQAREVAKLRSRVTALEQQAERDHKRFKEAVRYIRALQRYIDILVAFIGHHAPGQTPPHEVPVVPDSLVEEI